MVAHDLWRSRSASLQEQPAVFEALHHTLLGRVFQQALNCRNRLVWLHPFPAAAHVILSSAGVDDAEGGVGGDRRRLAAPGMGSVDAYALHIPRCVPLHFCSKLISLVRVHLLDCAISDAELLALQ